LLRVTGQVAFVAFMAFAVSVTSRSDRLDVRDRGRRWRDAREFDLDFRVSVEHHPEALGFVPCGAHLQEFGFCAGGDFETERECIRTSSQENLRTVDIGAERETDVAERTRCVECRDGRVEPGTARLKEGHRGGYHQGEGHRQSDPHPPDRA